MLREYYDELIRKINSAYQLRHTKHGLANYVFGSIKIVHPEKTSLGCKCRINDRTYINASNGVSMGDDVTLSANCCILTTGLDYESWAKGERKHLETGVIIGSHVWVGANAVILPGISISGEYVVIGAGAVVTKNILESHCIYAGNPARLIKMF